MDSDHLAASGRWLSAFGALALLAACATSLPPATAPSPSPPPAIASAPAPAAPATAPPAAAAPMLPTPAPASAPAVPTARPLVAEALAWADRLRTLSNGELAAEITRLSAPGATPLQQLTLALALLQLPSPAEGARAATLLQGVIANPSDDARPLHPLARQVAAQYAQQQRRLEEQLERQSLQLREAQRRIDQLTERLEALRAIERSMPSRAR
ncbi:MAG: hypothetical protein V4609_18865 [Pseudomonadota bacterium]